MGEELMKLLFGGAGVDVRKLEVKIINASILDGIDMECRSILRYGYNWY